MQRTITKLTSTNQEVFRLPSIALAGAPKEWNESTHERVLIPNPNGRNHIQIVRKNKLKDVTIKVE